VATRLQVLHAMLEEDLARAQGQEVALPALQALAASDPLTPRVMEQMLVDVATSSMGAA